MNDRCLWSPIFSDTKRNCPGRSRRLLVINVPSEQGELFVFLVMERDVKTKIAVSISVVVLMKRLMKTQKKNKWVLWVETT